MTKYDRHNLIKNTSIWIVIVMNPFLLLTLVNPTDKFPAEYYYYYRYYRCHDLLLSFITPQIYSFSPILPRDFPYFRLGNPYYIPFNNFFAIIIADN